MAGSGEKRVDPSPGEVREGLATLPHPCCPHLGQASEQTGAAGRAAADGGEGIAEDQAAAGQGIQVRGGDGAVVVSAALEAPIVR